MDLTDRNRARTFRETAGFWGRQTQGNVKFGGDVETVRMSARRAATNYLNHQNIIEGVEPFDHRERDDR